MKKKMILLAAVLLSFNIFVISGCSEKTSAEEHNNQKQSSEQPKKEKQSVNKQTTEAEKSTTKKKSAQAEKEKQISEIQKLIKEGLRNGADVKYDDSKSQFSIIMTDEKLKSALAQIKNNPDNNQKWTLLTKVMQQLSKQIKEHIASGYTIRLMDPNKPETAWLNVMDGKITKNLFANK